MLEDASLWQEFAAESEEHLDAIERLLSQAGAPDRAAVNSLFRAFHSLKGMSAALGAPGMTAVAHACEDFLGLARSGERRIADAAADALLAAVDAMRRQRDALLAARQDAPPPRDLLARLHRLSGPEAMPAAPASRTPG